MSEKINCVIAESASISGSVNMAPFCVIREKARIEDETSLGVGCVIEEGVKIGQGCKIGNYVSIHKDAILEDNVTIGDHSTIYERTAIGAGAFIGGSSNIGRAPKASATSTVKNQAHMMPLKIGKNCTIGCSAVIYAGSVLGESAFVGDGALIRERCQIGEKVVVGSGCAVENDTAIGAYTKIQTGSYITAYMEIGEQVFIAPMVTTTNDNYMGRTEKRFQSIKGAVIRKGARIGGGAILLPGVEVSEETFVAAGSLITKNTPGGKVMKGFPAKPSRDVPEEELLAED